MKRLEKTGSKLSTTTMATAPKHCVICMEEDEPLIFECNACHVSGCVDCIDSYLEGVSMEKRVVVCPCCKAGLTSGCFLDDDSDQLVMAAKLFCAVIIKDAETKTVDDKLVDKMVDKMPKFRGVARLTRIINREFKATEHTRRLAATVLGSSKLMSCAECTDGIIVKSECLGCGITVCKECFVKKEPGHACTQDDLNTVKMLSESTKCPDCGVKISKIEGCRFMTCTRCECKFDYYTGVSSRYGTHATQKYSSFSSYAGVKRDVAPLTGEDWLVMANTEPVRAFRVWSVRTDRLRKD